MSRGHRTPIARTTRRRYRRLGLSVGLAVGLVVLALALWVGVRGMLAATHLRRAATALPKIEQQISAGTASAQDDATLRTLQGQTAAARRLTGDAGWSLASRLPVVGDDLAAVRATAVAADVVAQDAAPRLLEVAGALRLDALRPVDGRVPLAGLQRARLPLSQAVSALERARRVLEPARRSARRAEVVQPVARAVASLGPALDRVTQQATTADRAAQLLPAMLGAGGRRTTLLVFQNLAEARSQGGIVGAYAVVEAYGGRLRVVRQGSAADVGSFAQPVLRLPGQAAELYQPSATRYLQNATQTIDFPTSARLAREMLRRTYGTSVDAVVAVDPVALSYLLRATGPLGLPGGQRLTADNAVSLLLNRIYFRLPDPQEQDAFFATAALRVFSALTAGAADPKVSLTALARAAGERRLLVWSTRPAEQRLLAPTVLSGRLDQGRQPSVGVFLNSASASKMSYYQQVSTTLAPVRCQAGGAQQWALTVRLRSTAPTTPLPAYVTGRGGSHDVATILYLAGPTAGGVGSVTVDGQPRSVAVQQVDGRAVASLRVSVAPGAGAQVRVVMKMGAATSPPRVLVSPTGEPGTASEAVSRCPNP